MSRATIRQVGGENTGPMVDQNAPPLPKPTPTQQFMAASGHSSMKYCVDDKGVRYGVMTPEYHEQYRLSLMLGRNATNERAFGMAMVTISVREIGGQPVQMPNSDGELQALMKRIGNSGHMAVGKLIEEEILASMKTAEGEGNTA